MTDTTPVPPGDVERLPDAKVLVDYWTLDCLLDWVFGQDEVPESVDNHHDRLRADMERFVTDADLRAIVQSYQSLLTYKDAIEDEAARLANEVDRLRAALGEREP